MRLSSETILMTQGDMITIYPSKDPAKILLQLLEKLKAVFYDEPPDSNF